MVNQIIAQSGFMNINKKDTRIGDIWSDNPVSLASAKVVLLGFPCDEGVSRNGGRPGAASAPQLIRSALYKLTPHAELSQQHTAILKGVHDAGDVLVSGNLEKDQQRLGKQVGQILKRGGIPIIIGGGHETSFGHILGYQNRKSKIDIMNWDAHADVRPMNDGLGHSGSPFRQAIELGETTVTHYTVAGLQPQTTSTSHIEYLKTCKASWFWAHQLDSVAVQGIYTGVTNHTMVTMDMDVVDQAFAPGVSAPNASGISSQLFLEIARRAGENKLVRSLDIAEVNPIYDRDNMTVRLAALAIWWFTVGLIRR